MKPKIRYRKSISCSIRLFGTFGEASILQFFTIIVSSIFMFSYRIKAVGVSVDELLK